MFGFLFSWFIGQGGQKSAVWKHKHCLTWDFLSGLNIMWGMFDLGISFFSSLSFLPHLPLSKKVSQVRRDLHGMEEKTSVTNELHCWEISFICLKALNSNAYSRVQCMVRRANHPFSPMTFTEIRFVTLFSYLKTSSGYFVRLATWEAHKAEREYTQYGL